ncbi:MAG: hypothetical protein KDD04_07505 [Sinomicrobium sp.]|nr:hypothetical protein [Sinomicrobium sp.]
MVGAAYRRGTIPEGLSLTFLFTLLFFTLSAGDFPYRFKYITTDHGLSQNTVDYILKIARVSSGLLPGMACAATMEKKYHFHP